MHADVTRVAVVPEDPSGRKIAFDHPRLMLLFQYVERHWSEKLTLHRAAEIVALDPSYLSRFFREMMGCTFRDWNRAIRMEKAKRLFDERGDSVRAVALAVGYQDLTTFGRAFKRYVGTSPRDYRAARQERIRKLRASRPRYPFTF